MKIKFLFILFIAFFATFCTAQPPLTPSERFERSPGNEAGYILKTDANGRYQHTPLSLAGFPVGTATVFAPNNQVNTATSGTPTINEIETWNNDGSPNLNAVIYYTATNDQNDPITYVFYSDGSANVTLLESPSLLFNFSRRTIPGGAFSNPAHPTEAEVLVYIGSLSPPPTAGTIIEYLDGAMPTTGNQNNPEAAWIFDGLNVTRLKDFPRKVEIPNIAFATPSAPTVTEVTAWLTANPQVGNQWYCFNVGSGSVDDPAYVWAVAGDINTSNADVVTVKKPAAGGGGGDPTMGGDLSGVASNAQIVANAVGATELAATAVSAGTYGSATQVAQVTFDADGRATGATNTSIAIPSTAVTDFNEAAQDATGAMLTNTGTINLAYVDGTPSIAGTVNPNSSTQKVEVAKNGAATTGTRKRLNFIEGSNVTLTVADDTGNDEVDITIAAASGGGGDPTMGGDLSGTASNAQIIANAVGANELAATAVTAATYGSATQVAQVTFDADGRATGATNVTITHPTQDPTMGGDLSGTASNAQIVANAVGATELAATAVSAGTYGSATQVAQVTFDADGRATGATNVTITTDGNGMFSSANQNGTWGVTNFTLGGATQGNLPDNTATLFNLTEGANSYLKIATTNSSEQITLGNSLAVTKSEGKTFWNNGGLRQVTSSTAPSANYTVAETDNVLDLSASNGSFSAILPASPTGGRTIRINKKTAPNTITIDGNGNNINGVATLAMTSIYDGYDLVFIGTEWRAYRFGTAITSGGSMAYDALTSGAVTVQATRMGSSAITLTNPSTGVYTLTIPSGVDLVRAEVFFNNTVLNGTAFTVKIDNSANSRNRRVQPEMFYASNGDMLVDWVGGTLIPRQTVASNVTTLLIPDGSNGGSAGHYLILN